MQKPGFSQDSWHFGTAPPEQAGARIALGVPSLDAALGGGVCGRRLQEVIPAGIFQLGAAAGFALALSSLSRRQGAVVWIQQGLAALEGGAPYGPGMELFGIAPSRLLLVRTATPKDALWAMEESLRCAGVAAAIGELSGAGDAADLTATRRINLVAEAHGVLPLLLRHQPLAGTSACAARWRVASAPGRQDGFGGIGGAGFLLSLVKNQRGPLGDWHVEWNRDEAIFRTAFPRAVAAPVENRPHRATGEIRALGGDSPGWKRAVSHRR
jgi:protein ImuA